jgi:glycosyltransferase involved in cell wall biosynthesis
MDPQTRPRLVTTVHGFYSVNSYSKIMTRGEAVICVSKSVKDYVLKNYPDVPEDKLTVIHRGVSSDVFPNGFQPNADWLNKWRTDYPQLKGKYVVTLPGRITRWKGPLDFVNVIAELKQRGLPVHGLIAGEPHPRKLEFLEEVKTAIHDAGLSNDITLVGHRSDLREVMAVSDVVISCSTDPEAFGRVTLEALAIGKTIAGYDHGGVHEQLSSLLPEGKVPLGDTEHMIKLLTSYYSQAPAPKTNSEFTLKQMLSRTLIVYQALLTRHNS